MIRKSRDLGYRSQIEDLVSVGVAIATIEIAAIGIRVRIVHVRPHRYERRVGTETMRPGVVCADGYGSARPALQREEHSVVALRTTVVVQRDRTQTRSVLRALEVQPSPLVGIGRCRARIVVHAVNGAGTESKKHR